MAKKSGTLGFLLKAIIAVLIVLVVGGTVGFTASNYVNSSSKTTKLRLESIGELATQVAYCTEVNTTDSVKNLFGVNVPFTQSKYVYSYDFEVKASYDFASIKYNVDENEKTINVKLPEAKILSAEQIDGSFKIYHENESAFNHIPLSENNKAIEKLKSQAKKDSVENGILDAAKKNAETLLKGFFAQAYDMKEYKIIYSK